MVVPKKCEAEFSYVLAGLFNMYLKKSCFPDCWKVSSVVPIFKNIGKGLHFITTALKVFFLWLVDHLEKCALFSVSQYGFRSSQSNAVLLAVGSDRIVKVFNKSGATRDVALDTFNAFDRVWNAGLLHNFQSYRISDQIFGLILSFLSSRLLRGALDGKSSQEYPVNVGVSQSLTLGPTLFLLYISDLPDYAACNLAICADDTTL